MLARNAIIRGAVLGALAMGASAMADDIVGAKNELAATGRLRVGVVSAPKADVFFVADADGKARGVTVELGNELARTLAVPSEFVIAHNSGEITDALEKGLIDVAFLPVDDERRKRVDFGPAYVLFESTCLVLGSSEFKTVSDLDRPGVRVGGEANTTTFRAATRMLKVATVVSIRSVGEAISMLRGGQIDAFALGRDALVPYQRDIPGSRLLDGYFHRSGVAIAVPKNRPAALAHARSFIEGAKAGGLIRRIFDNAGLASTAVAPAE
jgi:polar amino acid transport system substrate-binding protein